MVKHHEPQWRDKNKIGALMSRVNRHANGEIEMTFTQIAAAKLFLSKTLPDLKSSELTGKDGGAIVITATPLSDVDKQILADYQSKLKGETK